MKKIVATFLLLIPLLIGCGNSKKTIDKIILEKGGYEYKDNIVYEAQKDLTITKKIGTDEIGIIFKDGDTMVFNKSILLGSESEIPVCDLDGCRHSVGYEVWNNIEELFELCFDIDLNEYGYKVGGK